MFKFELLYKPTNQTSEDNHQIVIHYGHVSNNNQIDKSLGNQTCIYSKKKWTSKFSIDHNTFQKNITGLWVMYYDKYDNNMLTPPIIINEEIICRKKSHFDSKITLTPEITLIRSLDPYCVKHNIFTQQYQTSLDVVSLIQNGCKHVVMISQCQSGKTGTAKSIAYNLSQFMGYAPQKLFFICGMNDNNLLDQAKIEFKGLIPNENILFSKKLQKTISDNNQKQSYKKFSNSVLFIDESHYASQQDSLVYKFLKNIVGVTADGLTSYWDNRDVTIISISATPLAEIANLTQPKTDKKLVVLNTGNDYYGLLDMFQKNLIKQSYNLNKDSEIEEFLKVLKDEYKAQNKLSSYKYCLVRLASAGSRIKLENQINAFIDKSLQFINYYSGLSSNSLIDFNKIIDTSPSNMTIIWIYGSLRAGKQLNTKNIAFVHDSHCCAPDVATQGLAGRLCGYNKHTHNVVCYTNLKAINKFVDWIQHHYDPSRIPAGGKDIINGFDANNQNHWQSNIPILFKMDQILIDYCVNYRLTHGKKNYDDSFKTFCKNQIRGYSNDKINNILDLYSPSKNGGFMILDHLNKINSIDKFWESNHSGVINKKATQGFVTPNTEPTSDKLFYIFFNLVPQHMFYGHAIICYKEFLGDLSEKKSVVSTKTNNINHPLSWNHILTTKIKIGKESLKKQIPKIKLQLKKT